jgi:hypothetical protein
MSARLNAAWLRRFWVDETPAGLVNGTNTLYVVSQTPLENDAVDVFLDGLKKIPGVDYTISGLNITFTTAPVLGQTVRVNYIRLRGE